MHAPDAQVEAAILDLVGDAPMQAAARSRRRHRAHARTARPARRARRRASISARRCSISPAPASRRAGLRNVQLRQGDVYAPPVERGAYDLVVIHQVLHFLDDPGRALDRGRAAAASGRTAARRRFRRPRGGVVARAFRPPPPRLQRRGDRRADEGGGARRGRDAPHRAGRAARPASSPSWSGWRAIPASSPTIFATPRGSSPDAAIRLPDSAARARPIRASFEFFPAKSEEMESDALGGDQAAGAARPRFRLRHLRRRRLDARAHPRHRREDRARHLFAPGRASHLRRRLEGRGRRRDSRDIGTPACATSWRCAAIPRAASIRPMSPHPDGYQRTEDLVAAIKRIGDFEVSVVRLSREASAKPDAVPRRRRAETQSRRRRGSRDQSVLFRQFGIFALSRRCGGGRNMQFRSCRASCRCRTSNRRPASPNAQAPACRLGWPIDSRGSRTT